MAGSSSVSILTSSRRAPILAQRWNILPTMVPFCAIYALGSEFMSLLYRARGTRNAGNATMGIIPSTIKKMRMSFTDIYNITPTTILMPVITKNSVFFELFSSLKSFSTKRCHSSGAYRQTMIRPSPCRILSSCLSLER